MKAHKETLFKPSSYKSKSFIPTLLKINYAAPPPQFEFSKEWTCDIPKRISKPTADDSEIHVKIEKSLISESELPSTLSTEINLEEGEKNLRDYTSRLVHLQNLYKKNSLSIIGFYVNDEEKNQVFDINMDGLKKDHFKLYIKARLSYLLQRTKRERKFKVFNFGKESLNFILSVLKKYSDLVEVNTFSDSSISATCVPLKGRSIPYPSFLNAFKETRDVEQLWAQRSRLIKGIRAEIKLRIDRNCMQLVKTYSEQASQCGHWDINMEGFESVHVEPYMRARLHSIVKMMDRNSKKEIKIFNIKNIKKIDIITTLKTFKQIVDFKPASKSAFDVTLCKQDKDTPLTYPKELRDCKVSMSKEELWIEYSELMNDLEDYSSIQ